ncbi:MAG: hypothetical protein CMB99_12775 [Flavobacteriaceae bacterium]|nr:hypothetical protein [Flavobacteriaceae bacterium]|tara:strand:- start:91025 stop:91237 length:213 start_codon:yes stop_codon:yes gene_type:complete
MRKLVVFLVLLLGVLNSYGQCAMCKAVIENGNESMAEGVNNGITYLMVFPYILVGFLIYTIYRYKKGLKN